MYIQARVNRKSRSDSTPGPSVASLARYSLADLALWDILFGTFRNPREFRGECGFENGVDRKLGGMLAFGDVNAPLYGPDNRGVKPRAAVLAP